MNKYANDNPLNGHAESGKGDVNAYTKANFLKRLFYK